MDFEEKLIEEVRKQPILFNLGLNDYKNLRKKDSAWKEVGSAMKCDEVQCKKRWKGLRDCYKRVKRSQQLASGSGAPSPKRKWRYMEAISFLDEVQSSRSSVGNVNETDLERNTEELPPFTEINLIEGSNTESPRTSSSARKENQQKFNDFLDLAAESISTTCSEFSNQTKELDSSLHFQSLANKIKESGLSMYAVNDIEAKVSALVFAEIQNYSSNEF